MRSSAGIGDRADLLGARVCWCCRGTAHVSRRWVDPIRARGDVGGMAVAWTPVVVAITRGRCAQRIADAPWVVRLRRKKSVVRATVLCTITTATAWTRCAAA